MSLIMTSTQRTEEWYAARLGYLSASKFKEATSFLKTGADTADRLNLKIEILTERLTRVRQESYVTKDMQRGIDLEPAALEQYKAIYDGPVSTTGFVKHASIDWLGCSPDGLAGDDGLVEIKVPKPTTYVSWCINNDIPEKHLPQLQCQLAVTQRNWVDFVAYCPEMPEPYRLFVRRLWRDDAAIRSAEQLAVRFLDEVREMERGFFDTLFDTTEGKQ